MTLVLVLALLAQAAANAGLRIAVIEGEGAVNIIQQKTAVAPVVEVRDRNNLPVPGAVVTFSLGGPGASFGGASTLVVTTNAAGQAVAAGFTPTAAGAIQIHATAVFQGQSAVAAITQTNVMTAAQAAASASSASGASGAAGAGGGLSATTIGIAAGAVGAGALAATKLDLMGGGKTLYSSNVTVTLTETSVSTRNGAVLQTCTGVWTFTAPLKIELDASGDSVSGRYEFKGTTHRVSSSCGGGNAPTPADATEGDEGPVSGTRSSITFRASRTFTGEGATNNEHAMSFSGALNGDTITGAVTLTWKMSGAVVGDAATTFVNDLTGRTEVTLTKQ